MYCTWAEIRAEPNSSSTLIWWLPCSLLSPIHPSEYLKTYWYAQPDLAGLNKTQRMQITFMFASSTLVFLVFIHTDFIIIHLVPFCQFLWHQSVFFWSCSINMRKIVVHDILTPLLNECYYTDQNKSGLFNAAQHISLFSWLIVGWHTDSAM